MVNGLRTAKGIFKIKNKLLGLLQRMAPIRTVVADNDSVSLWQPGSLRLFISHRDNHKVQAKELAEELARYGISSFVAHDSIEPMETWQMEILKGLKTMEVMLAFITDDFQDSIWCNQEVGFALGRGIEIIRLKVEKGDPAGFISDKQALKMIPGDIKKTAVVVYDLLTNKLGYKERLQSWLVGVFVESPSFNEAIDRFDRMNNVILTLTGQEERRIQNAFKNNKQLYGCNYLNNKENRLKNFMSQTTGKQYRIEGRRLIAMGS